MRSRSRDREEKSSRISSRSSYRDRRAERSRSRDRDENFHKTSSRSSTNDRRNERSRSRDKDDRYSNSRYSAKDSRGDRRVVDRNTNRNDKNISKQEDSINGNGQPHYHEREEKADEETLREMEAFANEEVIDEEKEAERLILERKKRREEILRKHQSESNGILLESNSKTPNHQDDMGETDLAKSRVDVNNFATSNEINSARGIPAKHGVNELTAERDVAEADTKEPTIFDIFSSSPSDKELLGKQGSKRAMKSALLEGEDPHLQSNWDDGEGYYKPRIGELISDRYLTRGVVGKGVFSTVLLCQDNRSEGVLVAVKMIRNNDTMRKAAEKEVTLLTEIANADPDNKKHCVRLLHHMEYRNHVTMVFEPFQMNLRDTIKKFGKNVGINVTAVRMYSRQLLIALKHLSDLRIVHADIKPDNILVSEDLKQVKLCDFGSAFRETDSDNDPTPYLISRFYRAPEVILGLSYDRMVDLWSLGTCFYELFTGLVMFPGRTNNDMLKLSMEVKGRFPNRMLRAHLRAYEAMALEPHFHDDLRFRQWETDPITGKAVVRIVDITQPTKDLSSMLLSSKAGADDRRLVSSLADLLEKCLHLDPSKRLAVSEALKHSFFASK